MNEVVAGIDIGGTNIAFGLVDQQGNIVARDSTPTNSYSTPELMAESVAWQLVELANKHQAEIIGAGIGAPNGNYYNGTIEFAPNLPWTGIIPLAKLFIAQLQVDCLVTNDANAAAIGEMVFGAAQGMKNFVMVTLGTGLGSGFVVNGQLVYGHDGFAGELGHIIIRRDGRTCCCGRKGCLETYCSATGIVRTVFEWLEIGRQSSLQKLPIEQLTARKIAEAAEAGDSLAMDAFEFTGKILGEALADVVALTSPEAIILFGGLANAGYFIFNPTQASMEENMLVIFKNKVKLLPSQLPESNAALLGAASLIWNG